MNWRSIVLYLSLILLISSLEQVPVVSASYNNVNVSQAKDMIDSNPDLVILDVRTWEEYINDHIKNATHIPVDELEGRLSELDSQIPILVCCRTGQKSSTASQILADHGVIEVYNMLGGIVAWMAAGYPIVQIEVPKDYTTIQAAINAAKERDTILVYSATYYENVIVNKSVSLVGENNTNTIIDCNGTSFGIMITKSNVTVTGFTVQNSASGFSGIEVLSSHNTVTGNILSNNFFGIELINSSHNVICDNLAVSNSHRGIYVRAIGGESSNNIILDNKVQNSADGINLSSSRNDTVAHNTVSDSSFGIYLTKCRNIKIMGNEVLECGWGIELYSSNDSIVIGNKVSNSLSFSIGLSYCNNITIYHNNLIGLDRTYIYLSYNLTWDNGYPSGGNYWSSYTGTDLHNGPYQNLTGSDGIGDTKYFVNTNNTDNYPLLGMVSSFNATSEYHVQTICNSTISDFHFNGTAVSFDVTGGDGTVGFCRIRIPTVLMNDTYQVFVNVTEVPHVLLPCSNNTYSYLYFTYNHSTQEVIIVPEFRSILILPLLLVTTFIAVMLETKGRYIDRQLRQSSK